ncbi:hypothetical protein AVEN_118841-1, partial [Araneus ventricosus]
MSLQKQLSDVRYFVHLVRDAGYVKTYIVSIASELPLCLKRRILKVFTEIGKSCDDKIGTQMTPFPHLNWKMRVQVSSRLVSSEAALQNILKACRGVFGVWGQEQLEYFSRFLDNAWDVSSDIMKEVLDDTKDDPGINILNYISVNLGELLVT